MRQQYTFRVPPHGAGAAFVFEVTADSEEEAVEKARKLLKEQVNCEGDLHVDLTYGLTNGRISFEDRDIRVDGIIMRSPSPELSQTF